jgi:metallophosphoesterase superfamily enzyme
MMHVLNDWLLTPERVAVHLPSATAVVADLHLGYAEARYRRGEAVPQDSLDEQLNGLGGALRRRGIRRLVIAGDLLEDGRCRTVLPALQEWLDREGIELVAVVPGNHDLILEPGLLTKLPGCTAPQGFLLGRWLVVHGDGPLPDRPVVQGHEHPCLHWSRRPRVLRPRLYGRGESTIAHRAPCYLTGEQRLILPAYSRDAAGVNVLGPPRWRAFRCHVIAGEEVLDMGELRTLRRRATGVREPGE